MSVAIDINIIIAIVCIKLFLITFTDIGNVIIVKIYSFKNHYSPLYVLLYAIKLLKNSTKLNSLIPNTKLMGINIRNIIQ